MTNRLTSKLRLTHEPAAVLLSHDKPGGPIVENRSGRRCCLIPFILAAFKGQTAVFSKETTTCNGGKVGLGFGPFPNYPGGIEYFLSTGKEGAFEGEGYRKTPEIAAGFVEQLPITEIPAPYLICKPLSSVDSAREKPVLVIFYADVAQLAALTVLANYDGSGTDRVMIPSVSGCQSIFLLPYAESFKERPKAVVGMMDITVRPMLDANKVTFSVPYSMFLRMEEDAGTSFLEKDLWVKTLNKRRVHTPQAKT